MRRAPLLVVGLAAGCTSFEDPAVVRDLRVVAMTAEPPEQVVDIDLANPPQPADLLPQLVSTEVCALIADPGADRRLRYELTLCVADDDARCAPDVRVPIGAGVIADPESAMPGARACATVAPNGNLLGVLLEALEGDSLGGLGGLDYLVQLTVGGETDNPDLDLFASKTLRVAPRIPAARTANVNPYLERIDATLSDGSAVPLIPGRCIEQTAPIELRAGDRIRLTPIEPPDARETYVVPTIDGNSQTFTESLTYQWLTSAGSFSSGRTGGTRDLSGNPPELFTEYRTPRAADLTGPTDVQLWIIQRDERLGVQPYLSCIRVVP